MKRGTKCVVQTINLSNPKTCVRPKVQRIVSTDADSFPNRASDYWTPRPVAVKVRSWKDERGKCPPKYREPSQEESSPPLSTNAILGRAVAFFIKGAIIAGLICWTCREGLWGDSTQTEDLYYRMTSVIFPDQPPKTDSPHLEGIKYSAFETYNHMVVKGMDIIVSVPREVYRRLRDLLFSCDTTKEMERK